MNNEGSAESVNAIAAEGTERVDERTLSRRGFAKAALLAGIGMAGSVAFAGCSSGAESGGDASRGCRTRRNQAR